MAAWVKEDPGITGKEIVARFANLEPPVTVTERTAQRYRADALGRMK